MGPIGQADLWQRTKVPLGVVVDFWHHLDTKKNAVYVRHERTLRLGKIGGRLG